MDRLKGAMRSLARGAIPEVLYARTWRAKMVLQKSALRVDVVPYDSRLPPMANVPLKVGLPGWEIRIAPGHDVAVGWEDARPDRPYATAWTPGLDGTKPLDAIIHADSLQLGGPAEEALVLGSSYRHDELRFVAFVLAFAQAVSAALAATGPVPPPSKTAVAAALAELNTSVLQFNGQDYLSTVVRTV